MSVDYTFRMTRDKTIGIGTAGWSIPADAKAAFPAMRSQLESYGRVFRAVEINSSFYRSHRITTYQRWAAAVPDWFRFAVKVPKTITHEARLSAVEPLIDGFLAEVAGLKAKLGPLLVQLPPSLAFDVATAERFLRDMRDRFAGPIACEPRHASWFGPEADALLAAFRAGRVAADPGPVAEAAQPGGWKGLTYCRLHGAPRIYYSAYSEEVMRAVVTLLTANAAEGSECWCIFDNTASGAATLNALAAKALTEPC